MIVGAWSPMKSLLWCFVEEFSRALRTGADSSWEFERLDCTATSFYFLLLGIFTLKWYDLPELAGRLMVLFAVRVIF